jgi:hypothetical protein
MAMYKPGAFLIATGFTSRFVFCVPSCIIVIVSTPQPIATSTPSCMIWCAAIMIACEPEEQKRFTVVAATCVAAPRDRRVRARRSCPRPFGHAAAGDQVADLRPVHGLVGRIAARCSARADRPGASC